MVKQRTAPDPLDRVFRALASGARRQMVRRVSLRRRTVTELAEGFDMSLAAVSKHVRVLEQAGLVTRTQEGTRHWCRVNPRALEQAGASIAELRTFWNQQLDALEVFLAAPDTARRAGARTRRRRRS